MPTNPIIGSSEASKKVPEPTPAKPTNAKLTLNRYPEFKVIAMKPQAKKVAIDTPKATQMAATHLPSNIMI